MAQQATAETLGQVLTKLIESKGRTKKSVAKDATMDESGLRNNLNDTYRPLLHNLGALLNALGASNAEREHVLRVAGYPEATTLGGLLARLIMIREIELKILAADADIAYDNLLRILRNQVAHPNLYTLGAILNTLDVSTAEREHVLRVAGYPEATTLGGLLARLIMIREIELKILAADADIAYDNLLRILRNQVAHPNLYTLGAILNTLDVSSTERKEVLELAGYPTTD